MKKVMLFFLSLSLAFFTSCNFSYDYDNISSDLSSAKVSSSPYVSDDEHVDGSINSLGDENNGFIHDGRIFLSKEPYFVLYLPHYNDPNYGKNSPINEIGFFENEDNKIVDFYVSTPEHYYDNKVYYNNKLYNEKPVNILKSADDTCDENSYFQGRLFHFYDYELLNLYSEDNDLSKFNGIITLNKLDIDSAEAPALFEKLKTMPKDQIPELAY